MPEKFKHRTRVEIRFADIDSFGHVNNANYLTYFEQARVRYFDDIVDWPYDWSSEGVILARAEVNFVVPVQFRTEAFVFTRCSRIGTKSFDLEYRMVKAEEANEVLFAEGKSVMVVFNYKAKHAIPVPQAWREAIRKFEGTAL